MLKKIKELSLGEDATNERIMKRFENRHDDINMDDEVDYSSDYENDTEDIEDYDISFDMDEPEED